MSGGGLECLLWDAQGVVAWDPTELVPRRFPGHIYIQWNLWWLERLSGGTPPTVVVTPHLRGTPPRTGDDVIVWVTAEGAPATPSYSHDVGLVCKPHGTQWLHERTGGPVGLALLGHELVADRRSALASLAARRRTARLGRREKVLHVPLGPSDYLPARDTLMRDRRFDATFRGSLRNASRLRDWPKTRSRRRAVLALQRLSERRDDLAIDLVAFGTFGEAIRSGMESYREALAQSRIAVCPRGTRVETFRHYEALAAGCVVVTDRRPAGPLADAPLVVVPDWVGAEETIESLLADQPRLECLRAETIDWWHRTCEPEAVAARVITEWRDTG